MNHFKILFVLVAAANCAVRPVYTQNAPLQEAVVDPFTRIMNKNKRSLAFALIWEQRYKRDISTEILPFLDDPDHDLADRALRALGRLEKPGVLPELEKRRDAQKAAIEAGETDYSKRPARYFNFDPPIARIQSRDLHGKAKIEFVLSHMKGRKPAWTWDEAVEASKKMKESLAYLTIVKPLWIEQTRRLLEVVDMLYCMSKAGENIEELRRPFLFSKAQNDQLDGAQMKVEQEAEHLLDCSQTVNIVGEDEEYVYGSHLLSLGEPARVALKKRLEQILRDKPQFTHRFPLTCMLHAAARTGDPSYVPIFDSFEKEMTTIHGAAQDAYSSKEALQMGMTSSEAPQ